MTDLSSYIHNHLGDSIAELMRYCAIPTIAAKNQALDEGAQFTAELLRSRGFHVEILPSGGAPVVFAERKGKADGHPSDKTLLFYNHYDVQPEEPLELWDSPPFDATLRDGKLFARGVSDDKGHLTHRLLAIDALLARDGELPCNVKFLVEGEEEVGSTHIEPILRDHAQKFAADACIWEFGGINHLGSPSQSLGMRGLAYFELSVELLSVDVHSGLGGSIFPNAAWRLVWALNSLKGLDGRIRLPGFYDTVKPYSERDRELFAALPPVVDEYRSRFGVKEFLRGMEDELEIRLAEVFEPTCTICGLTSGYQGPGSKTVLPAKASAKVDFRLVPNQDPAQVKEQLRVHLDAEGFNDVQIKQLGGIKPARTDPDDPFVKLVMDAALDVYDKPMEVVPMIGGSGPNHAFIHYLNLPIATSGIGHPGSNAHAPNENIRLDLYELGARHAARIIERFGEEK